MGNSPIVWKKGRGKLGIFAPLLGRWRAEADSPMGRVVCTRTFSKVLDGAYIQLTAGLARMAYWPDEAEGFHWAVESQTKKGWRRFTEHHYKEL